MKRRLSQIWVLIALLTAGSAPTMGVTVVLQPDCGGSGFSGTAREGAAAIKFMSCPSGDDCHTRIGKPTGERMTEALIEGGNLRLWLGDIEVFRSNEELTEEQKSSLELLLSSPESDLARELPQALAAVGIDSRSPSFQCLNVQMQGYEYKGPFPPSLPWTCHHQCNNSDFACLGCCGWGCTGNNSCGSSCTSSCAAHDECFRGSNPFGMDCMTKFYLAADSDRNCRLRQTGSPIGQCSGACICCDL